MIKLSAVANNPITQCTQSVLSTEKQNDALYLLGVVKMTTTE